jgi:catechol 2,3-dioxygenase-like lactoylglutathione lyase family enzyme
MTAELTDVPGFLFFDHVAISVKPGELEAHVQAYKTLGFREVHREDVLGTDQVREVLLQVGDRAEPGAADRAPDARVARGQADREERRARRPRARGAARRRHPEGRSTT